MMKRFTILLLAAFAFNGCYIRSKKYWRTEEAKMQDCRNGWNYQDLPEKKEFTVLLFRRRVEFYRIYPAFAIGVTSDMDTVAIVDKDFDTTLKTGQKITISPAEWTAMEKVEMDPVFSVYPHRKTNDLHCVVKEVYYVRFEVQ